jgi:prostamide/prostaglandin F2alpha synthase
VSFLGTSKSRQETRVPADAGGLAAVTVRDLEGREVRLGELWEDQPAVLVFLRHYG